ncbi:MAG: thioredoxin family protein [Deltaproteobacteria bacterium]|nr:thioredoxin family protein [Deltaproteobacteria bacterium]
MSKKYTWALLNFLSIFILVYDSHATVTIDLFETPVTYQAGKSYPVSFRVKVSESWYIHGTGEASDYLIPTALSFKETPAIKIKEVRFPEPEKKIFDYSKQIQDVYAGEFLIKATLLIKENAELGKHLVRGTLTYQACSDKSCLPPKTISFDIKLQVITGDAVTGASEYNQDIRIISGKDNERPDAEKLAGRGIFLSILIFFLAGLGLNLTPCIYPLIPITVSYFGGKSRDIAGSSLLHGTIYILGIAMTNSFLGISASLSGEMIGSALQNPFTLIFVAAVLLIMGSSFFGLWEFRLPMGAARLVSGKYRGYFGTFFMGLTLGIVAAPCIGPFLIGLLTYVASEGDPLKGFINFFALSIGMGLPVSVLAIITGFMDRLPLSGGWLLWIKKIMGWIMFIMASYMIGPVISGYGGRNLLFIIVILLAGAHMGWLDRNGDNLKNFKRIKRIAGTVIISCCLIYLAFNLSGENGVKWVPYSPEMVEKANNRRMPLIIDFYANWCEPCREMERNIFRDPEIAALTQNLTALKVDLTRRNQSQDELLGNFGVIGVPTLIFINKDGIEERQLRIEGLAKKSDVLRHMRLISHVQDSRNP